MMESKLLPVPLVRQIVSFLIVGGLSFGVDYSLFSILYSVGVSYLLASVISFSISVVFNYILTRRYVFSAARGTSVSAEFVLYLLLNFVALILNTFILFVCAEILALSPFIGKVVATAVVLVFNFITRKLLIEYLSSRASRQSILDQEKP